MGEFGMVANLSGGTIVGVAGIGLSEKSNEATIAFACFSVMVPFRLPYCLGYK